jgi:hypothetical protein
MDCMELDHEKVQSPTVYGQGDEASGSIKADE